MVLDIHVRGNMHNKAEFLKSNEIPEYATLQFFLKLELRLDVASKTLAADAIFRKYLFVLLINVNIVNIQDT
jgi:hypothetical protein